jgi:hypothetical protein
VLLVLWILQASRVDATVLVAADLGELSREARAIVRGRVVATETRWTEDRRSVETLVTVEAEAMLKGSLSQTFQFAVPGGLLGRYRSILVGSPEFITGQRIVIFLGWHGPSVPYVLGLSQGVFRVVTEVDGAQLLVIPPPTVSPYRGAARIVRGDTTRRPMRLPEFEQRVRALAGESR